MKSERNSKTWKECHTEDVKHEESATQREYNTKKVQNENNEQRKEQPKKVQRENSARSDKCIMEKAK